MKLDSRQRVHLEWMFENQPELVRQLHREKKLRAHLEAKHQQALRLVDELKRDGNLSEEDAFEAAVGLVLAPSDGPANEEDPAPQPVPRKEQQGIYRSLEL